MKGINVSEAMRDARRGRAAAEVQAAKAAGQSIDSLVAAALKGGAGIKRDAARVDAKVEAAKAQLRRG